MAVVMVMVPDWPHGAPEPVTYCFGCFFTVSLWAVALIAPGRKGDNLFWCGGGPGGDGDGGGERERRLVRGEARTVLILSLIHI